MSRTPLNTSDIFIELKSWCEDEELLAAIKDCISIQRISAADILNTEFRPNSEASLATSDIALQALLDSGNNIHGISKQPEISNVIAFNTKNVSDAVMSDDITRLRNEVDALVDSKFRQTFDIKSSWGIRCSGHFWYPPGGYMGWHTNSESPGWRLYISYTDEPGKSYFRYRHPETKQIITSMDHKWDIRMFHVSSDKPLWHTIYSDTNRFSLGYILQPRHKLKSFIRKTKRLLQLD